MQSIILDGNEPLAVEVAHSFFVHFFANAEKRVNLLGRTLVAKRREAAVGS